LKKPLLNIIKKDFHYKIFKKNFFKVLLLGLFLSLIYLSAFLIFKNYLNLDNIANNLKSSADINSTNIIFIGLYIIFINSILEEFFWRGFIFKELNKKNRISSYLLTGLAFSFHHVIFYYSWFNLPITIIVTLGLIIYSLFASYIFEKYKDLFSCWLIHILVDIVQIYIALVVFKVI
jgi:membrane protease YdiL (CAAX protease family)